VSESCRSCQAPVLWLKNIVTGKPAPIDAEPAPNGNIRVDVAGEYYSVVAGQDRADALERGDPLHTNHFATCPQARSWKGGKKAMTP
jgi:hypothetical protein